MTRIGFMAAVVLVCALAGAARATDDGGVESPLALGSGGRAMGLGRTGVAFASDADAMFWNAARLGLLDHAGLSLFHTALFADGANYSAGFAAYPSLDVGTFGIGFQRLDVSGIERRDERNQLLGTFGNAESSFMLGYGRRFGRTLSVGTSLRLVQQSIDAASDASVGLDLGAAFETSLGRGETHRLGLGLNLRNLVTPRLLLQDSEVPDPRSVKLGGAYTLAPGAGQFVWLAAIDLDVPDRADPRFGAGVEVTYRGLLALRAGADGGSPTFGVGVAWRGVRFDYALVDHATLERGDRFSLQIQLGRGVGERRLAREQARDHEVATQLAARLEQREADERARARAEATAAFEARRFEDALRAWRRALVLDPDDAAAAAGAAAAERELALAQALALVDRGATGEGAAALQAILDRWPDETRAAHKLDEVRAALRQAADRDRQVQALLKQALADFAENRLAAADGALRELLRLEPTHEVALELAQRVESTRAALGAQALAQARTLASRHDFDAALQRLSEARRLLGARPEFARLSDEWMAARLALARAEDTTSRPPEPRPAPLPVAKPSLTAQQKRELQQRYQDGLEAFGRGDFQLAIRSWRAVWIEWPEHPSVAEYLIKAYLYEAIALYSSGKYEQAIELCTRVLEIDASNAKAKRYLRRMLEEKSELQQIGGGGNGPE
jgi:tetratricopeptide (TPR) repeat protein